VFGAPFLARYPIEHKRRFAIRKAICHANRRFGASNRKSDVREARRMIKEAQPQP
jgi:hypothetical protein